MLKGVKTSKDSVFLSDGICVLSKEFVYLSSAIKDRAHNIKLTQKQAMKIQRVFNGLMVTVYSDNIQSFAVSDSDIFEQENQIFCSGLDFKVVGTFDIIRSIKPAYFWGESGFLVTFTTKSKFKDRYSFIYD
jgi:hypothetical protein